MLVVPLKLKSFPVNVALWCIGVVSDGMVGHCGKIGVAVVKAQPPYQSLLVSVLSTTEVRTSGDPLKSEKPIRLSVASMLATCKSAL